MEAAAHGAAAAVARACAVPDEQQGGQADEASRRLREIGYYVDIAQRMGYLPLGPAAELLERQTLTSLEVGSLLEPDGDLKILAEDGGSERRDLARAALATLSPH